jgi:hypothetical protein
MKKRIAILLAGLILVFVLYNVVQAVTAVPGSSDDPIITASFLDKKLTELKAELASNLGQSSSATYSLVDLPAGKRLIGDASTEMILRGGKVKVVSSNGSGLSDVTKGGNIEAGQEMVKDHLVIVPRADGRGVEAQAASVLMVRGKYQIQ